MYFIMLLKYSGTIHLRKAVCTDHVDFPMLFAELQYLSALVLPKKTVLVLNSSFSIVKI